MEKLIKNIDPSWESFLEEEMEKDYFQKLSKKLEEEYKGQTIYPDREDVFKAFEDTGYDSVKAVILGQDPYHGPDQANGLAFSVKKGTKIPPSLRNIYKEMEEDLDIESPDHGDLTSWARQGVLLLNAAFTVRKREANSHRGYGWEIFTDNVVKYLNKREEPIVFILWGANAREKKKLIDLDRHFIVESVHPSPLSSYRGFFGSKPFSKTNSYLEEMERNPIDWEI